MGSDSGRQPGARSPSTLRIPPAPGSPSNPRNPALPRVGCPWPEQPWSRSQLGREGGGGASIRLPWGDLAPHHPSHVHLLIHLSLTHQLTNSPDSSTHLPIIHLFVYLFSNPPIQVSIHPHIHPLSNYSPSSKPLSCEEHSQYSRPGTRYQGHSST